MASIAQIAYLLTFAVGDSADGPTISSGSGSGPARLGVGLVRDVPLVCALAQFIEPMSDSKICRTISVLPFRAKSFSISIVAPAASRKRI